MGGTKCLRLGRCELKYMGGVLQNDSSMRRHPNVHGWSMCAAFLPGTRVNELACAAQGKTGLVFANLIFASTIFLHLFLLSLPSSPFSPLAPLSMQIGLSLHAHAINPHSDTHAHVQQSTRWGMCPRSPPPPPPHRHPRLPGAHEAAASLQQPSPMRVR